MPKDTLEDEARNAGVPARIVRRITETERRLVKLEEEIKKIEQNLQAVTQFMTYEIMYDHLHDY